MKKLALILIALLMIFSTASAENRLVSTLFGTVANNNYTNETLGLGFEVGEWHLFTEQEIAEANQWQQFITDEQLAEAISTAQQLMIMQVETIDHTQNVNVLLQDMSEYSAYLSTLDLSEMVEPQVAEVGSALESMGASDFQYTTGTFMVGGEAMNGYTGQYKLMGMQMFVRQVFTIRENYLVVITATSVMSDQTDGIFARFYDLNP